MNQKLEWPSLFLFAALLFGAVVRFMPGLSTGFPLNDGGMFHVMTQDLMATHYLLPQSTIYNFSDIPFAYPPLGLYVSALLADIFSMPLFKIFLWLPALINTLSILAFYKLAGQFLNSRMLASLATLVYALSSRAFVWQVMGGGVTRAFGMLFLLLMLWQAVQLFRNYDHKSLAWTILFGALTILSHPQTALHAVIGGTLIFIFYGRTRRGMLSALMIGLGVGLLTAPWWVTVLSRHGLAPLLSAGQTSQRTLEFYLIVLKLHGPGNLPALAALILFYIGLWDSLRRRDFFYITWIVLAYLIDTRGADGVTLVPEAMLAGVGLFKLAMFINHLKEDPGEALFTMRRTQLLISGLLFYSVLAASISDFQLINTSLTQADRRMFEWVNSNVEDGRTFLLATGHEYSMSDPLQEWFPALTHQHSATTMQGLEWTLGDRFFPWYEQLVEFQHCADIQCVTQWSLDNRIDYDYLIVMIPPEEDKGELANSLRSLGVSARSSALHLLIHEAGNALVFELSK